MKVFPEGAPTDTVSIPTSYLPQVSRSLLFGNDTQLADLVKGRWVWLLSSSILRHEPRVSPDHFSC